MNDIRDLLALQSRLGQPGADGSAAKPDPATVKALAEEFESLLLLQMMRQMRETVATFSDDGEDKPLGNMDALTDTIDGEMARFMTKAGGMGLAGFLNRTMANVGSPPSTASAAVERQPAQEMAAVTAAEILPALGADADEQPALADTGAVTSPFGWRTDPIVHAARFHGGVDVRAAYGQEVPAAGAGRVVRAGEQGGYGLTVLVEHADGLQTRYAHLSSLAVRPGDLVTDGQAVGRAGQSGRATGPHVHLELLRDGRQLDPASIVRAAEFKDLQVRADSLFGSPSAQEPQRPVTRGAHDEN